MPNLRFLIPNRFSGRAKLLDDVDAARIRTMHWKEFDRLVCEVFRRIGYTITDGTASKDGEVDFIATTATEKVLVQCDRRNSPVPLSTARELHKAMTAHAATGGALVTSGSFSDEAAAFAAEASIQLIDAAGLADLTRCLREVDVTPRRRRSDLERVQQSSRSNSSRTTA